MKKIYSLITFTVLFFLVTKLNAQTIWTGSLTTFTKSDSADWTLGANQDSITNSVRITRASTKGIFNIFSEAIYTNNSSPADTEWAFGTTANIGTLSFNDWETTHGGGPTSMVNQDMVLHLITDNIYIDIKFTSWSSSNTGGGFSYSRSTKQVVNVQELKHFKKVSLFPNPSNNFIHIFGLTKPENYTIYNVLGTKINSGIAFENNLINLEDLSSGLYFLKLSNGNTFKFIKK